MTAYGQILSGKISDRPNKKDGGGPRRKSGLTKSFEAVGFIRDDWNKWMYTWEGEFPVFKIGPGTIINDEGMPRDGLIASCLQAGIEILFAYGTPPESIKAQLDNEISEIIGHQADIADPAGPDYIPLWGSRWSPPSR